MRKVIISNTVRKKITDLRTFLVVELKFSEEAACKRADRIKIFLASLQIQPITLYVALKNGENLVIDVPYLKKNGFLHTEFLTTELLFVICQTLLCS